MLTVLIISYNRPHYLERAIKYWSLSPWPVIISDGSDEPLSVNIPSHMTYLHRPGMSALNRIIELAQIASTPYSIFSPDDDFLSFGGIDKSLEFLKKNPDYSMAQGLYTRFSIDMTHKKVVSYPDYQYASKYIFDDESPEKRIAGGMTGPVMHYVYAVMKTELLKCTFDMLHNVREFPSSTGELSFVLVLLAHGKYKTLPVFYGAIQSHDSSWSSHLKFEDWARSPSPEDYEKWRLNIAGFFTKTMGIDIDESLIVFDKAIAKYLDYKKPTSVHAHPLKSRFPDVWDKIPLRFKTLIRQIRDTISTLKMFISHRVNLMEYRRDWKRIKHIISESEFSVGRGMPY